MDLASPCAPTHRCARPPGNSPPVTAIETLGQRLWRRGRWTLIWPAFNLDGSPALVAAGLAPRLVAVALGLMLADTMQGIARPPVGIRPVAIGLRQLAASPVLVLTMVPAYRLG